MKSVCLVVQNVYDIDARVRRKAEALVSAGYSVDVLALAPAQRKGTYTLDSVNVYTVSLGKKRGSLPRYLFEYAAFFLWVLVRVLLLMRHRRYVVIDVNTLPDFLIFAVVPARWMGAKLILDMHEITPEFYISKYGIAEDSWLVRLLQFQEKISFNCADHVITINEPIQGLLARRGLPSQKTTVVMNAADEGRFLPSSHAAAIDDRSRAFVMVYHGTLTRIYGLDIAIEAFSMVHGEMPRSELWILGSGPEQGALAVLAQECGLTSKVKLAGQVPSADIPAWLDKCQVGILPIRRDVFLDFAFPNKLPEFIIMGKPVLMSRLRTIRHYFSEDALSYFEPNNPADLAKQMVRLRWDVMRQRYVKLVDDLAGSTRPMTEGSDATEMSAAGR